MSNLPKSGIIRLKGLAFQKVINMLPDLLSIGRVFDFYLLSSQFNLNNLVVLGSCTSLDFNSVYYVPLKDLLGLLYLQLFSFLILFSFQLLPFAHLYFIL